MVILSCHPRANKLQQVCASLPRGSPHCKLRCKQDIPCKLACQVQEWLLIVVVRLGADFIVLQVLLAVECDLLGLDLAVLHIDLVTTENDGDVLTHSARTATSRQLLAAMICYCFAADTNLHWQTEATLQLGLLGVLFASTRNTA